MKPFNSKAAAETAKQSQNDPDKGFLTIAAHLDAIGGTENSVKIRDFTSLTTDEPLEYGGENHGPNPVEYLATGVLACFSTTLRILLQNAGIQTESLHTDIEATLDMGPFFGATASVQHGLYDFRIKAHVKADATKEHLLELAQEAIRQSPGVQSLKTPVRVTVYKD